MDSVWRKEASGLYVNIFGSVPPSTKRECEKMKKMFKANQEFYSLRKDNAKSLAFRKLGNECFKKKDLATAMTWYNKSLCFAEIGTENVSLAYANRSNCFLQLHMYTKCLADIELAIQAKYPEHLMQKLLQRRKTCMESIENGSLDDSEYNVPSLSSANCNFPEMLNTLKISENNDFGRLITTTSDIPAGETILVEESFISLSSSRDHCHICLKGLTNLVSCANCSWEVFCHDTCAKEQDLRSTKCRESLFELREAEKDDDFKWESEEGTSSIEYGTLYQGIDHLKRLVLDVLNSFSSTESLIEFVEDAIQMGTHQIPDQLVDMKSKYRAFLQLSTCAESYPACFQKAYFTFNFLFLRDDIKEKFDTEQKKRFLMHLLIHQMSVINSNGVNTHDGRNNAFILYSYFNHSCAPNVLSRSRANMRIAFTLRPIKSGEQLFVSYISDVYGRCSVEETQKRIEHFGFQCRKCERCQPNKKLSKRTAAIMYNDSEWEWLDSEINKIKDHRVDEEKRKLLIETTVRILNRYGRNHWSIQLAEIMRIYEFLMLWLLGIRVPKRNTC